MTADFLVLFIGTFFDLLGFAIIARILLSWMASGGAPRLRAMLYDITEPILSFFRRIVPSIGMIDISPIVALLALDLVKAIVLYVIAYLAYT